MTDADTGKKSSTPDLMTLWMKNASTFWEGIAKSVTRAAPRKTENNDDGQSRGRLAEALHASFRLWETSARTMATPAAMTSLIKGLQTVPDISTRFMQTSIEGVVELQKRWADRLKKSGSATQAYSFDDLDSAFLNRWTDIYKKEIQQYLNIPQLGLTKFYQEKLNQTLDKHNLFQAALAEFLHLLGIPLEKSMGVLQTQLSELAEKGTLSEDSREYYQLWIKILEGHFMTLFKSPEYTQALGKTIEAMNQFLTSRNDVLEDLLKSFPVPTHKDMDALYEDLHQLKRRIRALEKQLQQKEANVT